MLILPHIYRNLRSSFNYTHDESHDHFNIFCVDDSYDHPTYREYEVPTSEIGLNIFLKAWVEGPNYILSLEGTRCSFLWGTQIYVILSTWWQGRRSIIMLVPDSITRKTLLSSATISNPGSFVYKLRPKWTKWYWDLGHAWPFWSFLHVKPRHK